MLLLQVVKALLVQPLSIDAFVHKEETFKQKSLCLSSVCKYYIGPIGDLSLLTATAAAAARLHSLH